MFQKANDLIQSAQHIMIMQGENPDGDSLGSAMALEAILSDAGKKVSLYCAINIPEYLRFINGWDRVSDDLPSGFDLTIIVDTASQALLEKALNPANLAQVKSHPVIVLDHHATAANLPMEHVIVSDPESVATGELIYRMAAALQWPLPLDACENLTISILADSLGLVTEGTTARTIHTIGELVERGVKLSDIDARRRTFMKKSPRILAYKGALLQRIEYFLDGQLALVHIPWEEIHEYSHEFNPSILVLDEMRLVTGVRLAIAIKTYPDGRLTGKIRCNPEAKIGDKVAGHFGGGGHPYSAGFKIFDKDYEAVKAELVGAVDGALQQYDSSGKS